VAEGLRGEGHGVSSEPLTPEHVRLHIRRG